MAKKDGTKEAFPKYEDWKAPWEVDAEGNDIPEEDRKFDAERARKLIYARTADLHRKSQSLDETTARAEELEQKIAEADDPAKVKQLQEELEAERKKNKKDPNALRWEIALDKGLTKSQARRLIGETREELEADADEILAEWGSRGKQDEEEGEPGVRKAPRGPVRTNGDPQGEPPPKGDEMPDPEKVADLFYASR